MSTTDEIMGLAAAMLRAGPNYDGAISELRAAVAALVAERDDALALAASRLADWDSMRQQWVKVMAERDALKADAEQYRWLVSGKRGDWVWSNVLTDENKAGHSDIPQAIDAAIAGEQK